MNIQKTSKKKDLRSVRVVSDVQFMRMQISHEIMKQYMVWEIGSMKVAQNAEDDVV